MNKKIQITAIFMALAIFGLCALIAPVCANIETTDNADPTLISEANASNESNSTVEAINATSTPASTHTDVATTTDTDPEATSTEEEASPGFGILGVMISVALLFLLIRKKA
ncbi:MAG: hypothetical protein C5S46_06675 [Candidatus Methanomarinus sp.]|jgi:hypothetical protein|uniref:Uncharacterized protein n=1 Tax=Candidatus Methanomarinus sp. TaxID=3386244 RepID=A0AC61S9X0_9EURY|nr:hypothetical protein C5S42_05875 [ANME-2 cluster archaeon]TKY91284.1 MAG: hypothetical protein C5S46_06675 [ANME-2 cluster archaeon]